MKTKSALSYFGSDASVAEELAKLLDGCKHVTIPFVGGASILPFIKARAIVCNDLNHAAINFYRHLSDPDECGELIRLCQATLSHPSELTNARYVFNLPCSDVLDAWAYWAVCWLGRKGKGGTKDNIDRVSVRWTANGGQNSTRIAAAAADLEEWAEHFKRCEWTCMDFRELATKVHDKPECGSYLDPPWVDAGRHYLHSFTEQDHRDLADIVSRFDQHRVVIRYGDHPLIRELYSGDRWHIIEASSRTQSNATIGELWITNGEAS